MTVRRDCRHACRGSRKRHRDSNALLTLSFKEERRLRFVGKLPVMVHTIWMIVTSVAHNVYWVIKADQLIH